MPTRLAVPTYRTPARHPNTDSPDRARLPHPSRAMPSPTSRTALCRPQPGPTQLSYPTHSSPYDSPIRPLAPPFAADSPGRHRPCQHRPVDFPHQRRANPPRQAPPAPPSQPDPTSHARPSHSDHPSPTHMDPTHATSPPPPSQPGRLPNAVPDIPTRRCQLPQPATHADDPIPLSPTPTTRVVPSVPVPSRQSTPSYAAPADYPPNPMPSQRSDFLSRDTPSRRLPAPCHHLPRRPSTPRPYRPTTRATAGLHRPTSHALPSLPTCQASTRHPSTPDFPGHFMPSRPDDPQRSATDRPGRPMTSLARPTNPARAVPPDDPHRFGPSDEPGPRIPFHPGRRPTAALPLATRLPSPLPPNPFHPNDFPSHPGATPRTPPDFPGHDRPGNTPARLSDPTPGQPTHAAATGRPMPTLPGPARPALTPLALPARRPHAVQTHPLLTRRTGPPQDFPIRPDYPHRPIFSPDFPRHPYASRRPTTPLRLPTSRVPPIRSTPSPATSRNGSRQPGRRAAPDHRRSGNAPLSIPTPATTRRRSA